MLGDVKMAWRAGGYREWRSNGRVDTRRREAAEDSVLEADGGSPTRMQADGERTLELS